MSRSRKQMIADHTGRLWLDGDHLRNRSSFFGDWDLRITDLRLVGEATTPNGPFVDDWMLVFAVDEKEWFEASMYVPPGAGHAGEPCEELAKRLGAPLERRLTASTQLASNVLWPPHLAGRPVFQYLDPPPLGWRGRVRRWFTLMPIENIQTWTDEIRAYLAEMAGER